jgi:hypothetical protein
MLRHLTLSTAFVLAITAPSYAGGPVIVEDTTETVEQGGNNWIVPVIIGGIIFCAIACGHDDDAPVQPPGPICYTRCR